MIRRSGVQTNRRRRPLAGTAAIHGRAAVAIHGQSAVVTATRVPVIWGGDLYNLGLGWNE